jgi:hypothetical protein
MFGNGDTAAVTASNFAFAKNGLVPLDQWLTCNISVTELKTNFTNGDPDLSSINLGSFPANTLTSFENPVPRPATNSWVRVG